MMSEPRRIPSIAEIRQRALQVFGKRLCLWQVRVVQAIIRGDRDIISIAGTGSGKTITFWVALLFLRNAIQIIVTPLNILGDQVVQQLGKAGITAISTQGGKATHDDWMVRHINH